MEFLRTRTLITQGETGFGVLTTKDKELYPTPETHKNNPAQRFDLHLPAGRLARDFGINIETGTKADCYRKDSAATIIVGYGQSNGYSWFY